MANEQNKSGRTKHFIMRLPDAHRALLDEMVAEKPTQSRSEIIRVALEEYAERHGRKVPGAA